MSVFIMSLFFILLLYAPLGYLFYKLIDKEEDSRKKKKLWIYLLIGVFLSQIDSYILDFIFSEETITEKE